MEVTIAFAVLFKFALSPQEEIAGVGTQNKNGVPLLLLRPVPCAVIQRVYVTRSTTCPMSREARYIRMRI